MIRAIFYSKFDTQEGPKVVHQVPDGAIVPSPTAQPTQLQLFSFSDVQFFVIPRQELCGNFIYFCSNGYRILGCPICLSSPRYYRNQFIFNICIVLAEDEEFTSYKSVVLKLADLMCSLEEQSGFLSRDFAKSGTGKIHGLCETLMEDLNNYCECMIPIDDLNTLNIKLFPLYAPPPSVKAWQVPLFVVRYEAFIDENWDLTMQRIVPFINGVNSTRMIAIHADVDFALTCRAIRHLVYYGCVVLLDIFSFSAIYAPTAQFNQTIVVDEDMQRECAAYVNTKFAPTTIAPGASVAPTAMSIASTATPAPTPDSPRPAGRDRGGHASRGNTEGSSRRSGAYDDIWPEIDVSGKEQYGAATMGHGQRRRHVVDGVGLVELYADLRLGKTVKQWYFQHTRELTNIDVRRFITYGVIKGFLYRVRKYGIATNEPGSVYRRGTAASASCHGQWQQQQSLFYRNRGTSTASHLDAQATTKLKRMLGEDPAGDDSHARSTAHEDTAAVAEEEEEDDEYVDDATLERYLDGQHHFDEICTELEMTDSELTARLKKLPYQVHIIHK